jgi:hypothetical protein
MAEAVLVHAPRICRSVPSAATGSAGGASGTLIVSEAALFGYLLFAYYYTGATAPPAGCWIPRPAQAGAAEYRLAAAVEPRRVVG